MFNTAEYNTFLNMAPIGNPAGTQTTLYDNLGRPVGFNPAPWNSVAEFDLGLASSVDNGQQYIKNDR